MPQRANIYIRALTDFQKAYDSIRRDGLKDKLETIGINGKVLDITHAMYKAPIGLKQGDILSKIFFNLFINFWSCNIDIYL